MHFTLKFLERLPLYEDVQPYRIYDHPELSPEEQSNCEFTVIPNVLAVDLRNYEHIYRLESEGFEVMNSPSHYDISAGVFESRTEQATEIIAAFLEETMALVKKRTMAYSVVAIDWRFRRNDLVTSSQMLDLADFRSQAITVATVVHCDFSPGGGRERIQMHLSSDQWEAVESGILRAKIVNVWRPLKTVKNAPLVLSDRRSVRKADLIEIDQVMKDKVTNTAFVYYQANQKWFWLSDQSPDEIFIFETWSPASDNDHADYSPHAAAYLHSSSDSVEPRESIEVRMIVLQEN